MVEFDPDSFDPDFSLSGLVLHVGDEVLLLRRCEQETYGGYWGLPAGRLDEGESPEQALVREVFEETRIRLSVDDVSFVHSFSVRYPECDFEYFVFRAVLDEVPEVVLDPAEHVDARFVSLEEALGMELVPGEERCLRAYAQR